jgi:hypothetical protein
MGMNENADCAREAMRKTECSANSLHRRAPAEVCQVADLHSGGDFAEPPSAGGEETAEQAAALELLEPGLPALGASAESLEDSCQLG